MQFYSAFLIQPPSFIFNSVCCLINWYEMFIFIQQLLKHKPTTPWLYFLFTAPQPEWFPIYCAAILGQYIIPWATPERLTTSAFPFHSNSHCYKLRVSSPIFNCIPATFPIKCNKTNPLHIPCLVRRRNRRIWETRCHMYDWLQLPPTLLQTLVCCFPFGYWKRGVFPIGINHLHVAFCPHAGLFAP